MELVVKTPVEVPVLVSYVNLQAVCFITFVVFHANVCIVEWQIVGKVFKSHLKKEL